MSSFGFVSAAATAALSPASPAPTIVKSWVSFSILVFDLFLNGSIVHLALCVL